MWLPLPHVMIRNKPRLVLLDDITSKLHSEHLRGSHNFHSVMCVNYFWSSSTSGLICKLAPVPDTVLQLRAHALSHLSGSLWGRSMHACVRACVPAAVTAVVGSLEQPLLPALASSHRQAHTHTNTRARTHGGWLICGSLSSAPVQLTSSLTEESHASPPLSTRPGFTRQGESRERSGTWAQGGKVSELVFTVNILSALRAWNAQLKQHQTEMKPGSFCLTERTLCLGGRICLVYAWLFLRSNN